MCKAKCSRCDKSDIYLKFKVPGNCQIHLFCSECYNLNLESPASCLFECTQCSNFYRSIIQPVETKCIYCSIDKSISYTCSVHNICNTCLITFPLSTIRECYKCMHLLKFTCYSCKQSKPIKTIKCPTHFVHRHCMNCYVYLMRNIKKIECKECNIFFSKPKEKTLCLICKRKILFLDDNRCSEHNLCLQCKYLLNKPIFLALHPQISNCYTCQANIKMNFGSICQNCGKQLETIRNNNLKITMLTCKFQHVFCPSCYTQNNLGNIISCKYCAFFFQNYKAAGNICLFCKRNRNNKNFFECKDCCICDFCLDFIKQNNPNRYIKSITCQEAQFGLCEILGISLDSIIEDSNHLNAPCYWEINCKKCRLIISDFKFCETHPLCGNCFIGTPYNEHNRCGKCKNIFESVCKKCFSIINDKNKRIENLACNKAIKDFYCNICFTDIKNSGVCLCKRCLELYIPAEENCCHLCKNFLKTTGIFWCSEHKICINCQFKSQYVFDIYQDLLGCAKCKQIKIVNSFMKNHQMNNANSCSDDDSIEENKFENSYQTYSSRIFKGNSNSNKNIEDSLMNYSYNHIRSVQLYSKNPAIDYATDSCKKNSEENLSESVEKVDEKIETQKKYHENYVSPVSQEKIFLEFSNPEVSQNEMKLIAIPIKTVNEENMQTKIEKVMKARSQENEKNIICCGQIVQKNECGHPICMKCLEESFAKKFDYFISLILESNLEVLNTTSWQIGCFKEECYLKTCFPFSVFEHVANRIVIERKLPEKIFTHFDLCFEGIKYYFYKCANCKYLTGNKPEEGCMWCLSIN
ncbi:hypothetical protein SteCoe_24462 [Stentor coeruleus]|uniref:Uncharacterized protein n=1 Tax=Stentor coeruleus TaxID=5963 RepID=A0A1R2BHF4_9CILI|nr:hypothetical protein SteCoe_24462 [Stentor coeruleus]